MGFLVRRAYTAGAVSTQVYSNLIGHAYLSTLVKCNGDTKQPYSNPALPLVRPSIGPCRVIAVLLSHRPSLPTNISLATGRHRCHSIKRTPLQLQTLRLTPPTSLLPTPYVYPTSPESFTTMSSDLRSQEITNPIDIAEVGGLCALSHATG
jgi:hypothetical protein